MLPKRYTFRLRKERGFFNKAQRFFSTYFTLFYVPAQSLRTVVVVPKKVARLATGRTRLRRQFELCVLEILPNLERSPTSFFICLVAKSAAVTAKKSELLSELRRAYSSITAKSRK